ncbi:transporter [Polynucleobacter sp. MWH-Loch1C5]|uniref:OmpP1/FadL family transporter n=1 Tax=Polynucleobacter sp. MWH-Loch1C5 TaxID=2689108 RepID=UPI001C0A9646|nr:OmpP1/FadL family transporter [Polynucleobacter sp. MWH-Loch1C5]MBU3542348.1 transporter [Polynucleobacter sp. MWH-Loch1C5]
MKYKLNRIAVASALTFISASVSAAGFQIFQQNASGLGNAYAGSAAVADNASTVFFNPAGMTELKGTNVSAGLNVVSSSIKFSNGSSSSTQLSGNGGDAGTIGVIPNAYFTHQIDQKLTLGFGIGAPFGSHSKYDNPWIGGAQALEFQIKTINFNPSLAYKLDDRLSVGFGINYQQIDAKYKRITGSVVNGNAVNYTTGMTEMDLSDSGSFGWNAGMLFKPDQKTKIGISYRSKIKHGLDGSLNTVGVTGNSGSLVNAGGTGLGTAGVTLPDMAFLSISHKYTPKIEMLGDISWTGWSSIPKIDVYNVTNSRLGQTLTTDFKDSWRFALGLNYQYTSNIKLKAGVAYDKTPVKGADTRLVSLPDNDRTWLSVGSQYQLNKTSAVDFGLAKVFIKNANVNNNQASDNRGLVNGSYKSSAWLMGIQYSQSF